MANLTKLERQFHERALKDARMAAALGYPAKRFHEMVFSDPKGAVGVAHKLLASDKIHSGFLRLLQMGRPDLSIETPVLETEYAELFSEQERAVARSRLPKGNTRGRTVGMEHGDG